MSKEGINAGKFLAQNQAEALEQAIFESPGIQTRPIRSREAARAQLQQAIKSFGDVRGRPEAQKERDRRKNQERFVAESLHIRHDIAFDAWFQNRRREFIRARDTGFKNFVKRFVLPGNGQETKNVQKQHACFIEKLPDDGLYKVNIERQQLNEPLLYDEHIALAWKNAQQEAALWPWYQYLMQDANQLYPAWFKYYVLKSVTLNAYIKGKEQTRHPDTLTTAMDFDAGGIALVWDHMKEEVEGKGNIAQPKFHELYEEKRMEHARRAKEFIENVTPDTWLKITDWRVLTFASVGTPWCLAGADVAKAYLSDGGVVHVYFDENKNPQIGVHVRGAEIREVRGADDGQDLRGKNIDILDLFLEKNKEEFSNIDIYKQQIEDNRKLIRLQTLIHSGEFDSSAFDKKQKQDYLKFLYEVDQPFYSFALEEREPPIYQLQKMRDINADLPVIFDCLPNEVAHSPEEIRDSTKVYVGPTSPGIFKKLQHIEHVYREFPGERMEFRDFRLGENSKESLIQALSSYETYGQAPAMLKSEEFQVSETPQTIRTVELSVEDLGMREGDAYHEVYEHAEKMGLALCPAEVGPLLMMRLNVDSGSLRSIAMIPIQVDGREYAFEITSNPLGHLLDGLSINSTSKVQLGERFVFVIPETGVTSTSSTDTMQRLWGPHLRKEQS